MDIIPLLRDALLWHNIHHNQYLLKKQGRAPRRLDQVLLLRQAGQGTQEDLLKALTQDDQALLPEFHELHGESAQDALQERVRSRMAQAPAEVQECLAWIFALPADPKAGLPDLEGPLGEQILRWLDQGIITRHEGWLKMIHAIGPVLRNHVPGTHLLDFNHTPALLLALRTPEEQRGRHRVVRIEEFTGAPAYDGWTRSVTQAQLTSGSVRLEDEHRDMHPEWLYYCKELVEIRAALVADMDASESRTSDYPFLRPLLTDVLGKESSRWSRAYFDFMRTWILAHEEGHQVWCERAEDPFRDDDHEKQDLKLLLSELLAEYHALSVLQASTDTDQRLTRALTGCWYVRNMILNPEKKTDPTTWDPIVSKWILSGHAAWQEDPAAALRRAIVFVEDRVFSGRAIEDIQAELAAWSGQMEGELAGVLGTSRAS